MAQFDTQIQKIAVFTSGGDAPGMNAALRAVVRSAIQNNWSVEGILNGYQGLLTQQFRPLNLRDMANIIQRGGTILKSGRCPDFLKESSRQQAVQNLQERNIDALVCIGGDGSMNGALSLWKEHRIPIVSLPGTIDNDIAGTDHSIGFDTAINTALDAIDRIRDTAASHDRLFIVEVMGRDSGFIALEVALAGGAEDVLLPEHPVPITQVIASIQRGIQRGKTSSILITAEGQKPGRAYDLAEAIRKKSGFEAKVCILGHVQRGGRPSAFDRNLASRMGHAAIQLLSQNQCNVMVGSHGQQLVSIELDQALSQKKSISTPEIELVRTLAN